MNNINYLVLEELTDDTKKKLKKIGLALGGAALIGGASYGGHKLLKNKMNAGNEKVASARKGWNLAQHGVNAGIIYKNTTKLFGDRIRAIPASLYLAKNFRNEKARNKESIFQQALNRGVDKLAGANKMNIFNSQKINRKRLLLTHAANALYAGAKVGGNYLVKSKNIGKGASKLGLNFLGKFVQHVV